MSPHRGTANAIERRLMRLTRRPAPKTPPPPQHAAPKDLFHDHAAELINRLSSWSLDLDRRESELDQREDTLNRQLRLLRQLQWDD